jgi:hypothetical protein
VKRALICLLLAASCGENAPPTVEELRTSNPTVQRFQELFVTLVGVEDPDGNVYAGKVRIGASSADGEVALEEEVLVIESDRDQTRGDVIIGVLLFGDVPLGGWKIQAIYEDEGGASSEPESAEITLTP